MEDLVYLADVGVGVLAHADVVGVDALDHRLLGEGELLVVEVVEIGHAALAECVVGTALLTVGVGVAVDGPL